MISVVAEQLSSTPHITPENQPAQAGITPGGLDPANNVTTLGKLQAGSTSYKTVVLIEGCKYVLSDAPQASVRAALRDVSSGDWSSATVLGGVFVDLRNSQSISPDDPFPQMGSCTIKVIDDSVDHSDVFGIFVNKRSSGGTARISSTVTRSSTTFSVGDTSGFAASGDAYIGAECFEYTGKTATTFTVSKRGKYSPFGTARTSQTWAPGSGGARFASYQRIAQDIYHTQNNPTVTEVPRVWIGKRVGVWLHTWDAATQQLNTHENAQLVFSGRIGSISDDPETAATVLELDHISKDIREAVVFRDQFAGSIPDGVYIPAGRVFKAFDYSSSSAMRTANVLTCVSGTPASVNEIKAGYYTTNEICSVISAWMASERSSNRLWGNYVWSSPTSTNDGLRTVAKWYFSTASLETGFAVIEFPAEVSTLLGIEGVPGATGQSRQWPISGPTNTANQSQGDSVPFASLIFKPSGPGRFAQEFSEVISYEVENQRGTFVDQYSYLPASVKGACDSTRTWGLFLFDEKALIVGSYDTATFTLTNCWMAPFRLSGDNSTDATTYIGRRADEAEQGPVTIRQVLVLESTFKTLFSMFFYSSGTSGYNHTSYDALGYGAGIAIPGELLGDPFERSLANLPGAESSLVVVIDEPTKFADLFRDDLRLRRSFIRWKDEHFEFAQWRTPLTANAIATLTEANKAAPAGTEDNHRIASVETDQWYWPVVKIDYARDFAVGRNGQYLKSIQVEDQTASDEAQSGRTLTLKMRNTYGQFQNTGAGIEELIKEFIPGMPLFSKPSRMITRSIDLRYFETLAPGDIVTITDGFARDPLTGARRISARAALVTRVAYQPGGATPSGSVTDMTGEVDGFFLDVHRGSLYSPCADVDWEANYAGFTAGYRSSDKMLICKPHQYSYVQQISTVKGKTNVGEAVDASWFPVGSKVVVVERDPADPTTYTSWSDTVASQSVNMIGLTTGLAGYSTTKRYRVIPADYSTSTTTQRDYAYQADDADERIQDLADAFQFAIDAEPNTFRPTNANTDKAELVPTLAYGDGKPMDVGMDRALVNTANAFIDYKSAHQVVCLGTNNGSPNGFGSNLWTTQVFTPIFFGTEHLSSTVTRTLTVAPIYRLYPAGVSGKVRITLARAKPGRNPSLADSAYGAFYEYAEPAYYDEYAQTAEWTVTSGSNVIGSDKTLSIKVKDLFFGYAFLIVECYNDVITLGLAKCIEGARTVS